MTALQGAKRRPGKPRALTPERESMLATLRRAGYGIPALAGLFGIAPRTVHAVLRREGVEGGRGRRVLTVAQEQEIFALRAECRSHAAIARVMGVHIDTARLTLSRPAMPND